jgi:hypothetical protein
VRRVLDPRQWSFEARFYAIVLVPIMLYVGYFRPDTWFVTLMACIGVRWLILPRWARSRDSRRDIAATRNRR